LDNLCGTKARSLSISPFHGLASVNRLLICVWFVLLYSSVAWSWQTGSSGGASKPASNPLATLLKEKPKAPVVAPELPAAIPEQQSAIPLPDVASRSLELGQKLRDAAATLPTREQLDAIQSGVA